MLVSYSQVLAKMKVVQRRNIHPYQRHCPHCDQILAYKTYKAHKRLYYNRASGAWITKHDEPEENNLHTPYDNEDHEVKQCEDDSPPCSESNSEYSLNFDINETPPKSDPALSSSDSDTCHSEIDGMYRYS